MGFFTRLFSGGKGNAESSSAGASGGGFRVVTATSEEVNRNSEEMGEMYFDCPKCQTAQRINNMGKMILKANPDAFSNTTCQKCGRVYNAGPRVKFGKCPGFDYSQL
jgi:hypothetical protein